MGCVASKLEEEQEVVTILRERKNYLKLAVERRYALAEAHSKYNKSLFAVSAAIKLFVARHSSPNPPYLITFNDYEESQPSQNQLLENVKSKPNEAKESALGQDECQVGTDSSGSEEEVYEEEEGLRVERDEHVHQLHQCQHLQEKHVNGYYYMQMPPPVQMESANGDFGWDFFNTFEVEAFRRPEGVSRSYDGLTEEDLKAVREQEGIPELEEVGECDSEKCVVEKVIVAQKNENNVKVRTSGNEENVRIDEAHKGLTVTNVVPEIERELLEALGDIEDYFLRAYYSGKEVSKMLEVDRVHLHSNLDEIKENSTKLLAIAWHRTTSSRPSSCKSLVTSSSKSSSTWTETKSDSNDNYVGMDSGSHSLTLERLYAWEKKLYEEVKAGDNTRKIYEKKCSMLKNQDVKGADILATDKTRAAVKDLHARILVAIRSAESISRRIDKLRDEELHPQICELLQGLMRNWKVMLEVHETQNRILSDVKSLTSTTYGKFCTDLQRLATLQLQIELHSWRTCFMNYISAMMGYVEALYNWLAKFVATEIDVNTSKRRPSSTPVHHADGPPLLLTCHNWLESIKLLPNHSVASAMKEVAKDVRALWVRQGEELQQKRKVDSLAKEYEKRLKQMENPILAIKLTDDQYEPEDDPTDKKNQLEALRKRLDSEREKHQKCVQQTQYITFNGLQTGFCSVFESLIHFSQASLKMYNNLANLEESSNSTSSLLEKKPGSEQEGFM